MLNINEQAAESKRVMITSVERLERIHEEIAALELEAHNLKKNYPVDRVWDYIDYTIPVYTGDGTLWRRMK